MSSGAPRSASGKLVITDDEGRATVVALDGDEISIGRGDDSVIHLTDRNVSRKHAMVRRVARGYEIEDLGSYNGTWIAGRKLTGTRALRDGENIQIGDYHLTMQSDRTTVRIERERRKAALTPPPADAPPAPAGTPSAPRPGAEPRFVVLAGPGKGKHFVLDRDELTIGQDPDCEIRIDHSSVSRAHAKVVNVGGVRILDLQSTNGVRVNDRDVPYAELEPGDIVELGEVKLRFVIPGVPMKNRAAGSTGLSLWLLVGVVIGFAGIAALLFVLWPAPPTLGPSTPVPPTAPLSGPRQSPAEANAPEVTALITLARAHMEKGAFGEAEAAAARARALLASSGSPTSVPDSLLREVTTLRAAHDEAERTRAQADAAAQALPDAAAPVVPPVRDAAPREGQAPPVDRPAPVPAPDPGDGARAEDEETTRFQEVRAAAADPERYRALACAFLRDFPTSRRAGTVRPICR